MLLRIMRRIAAALLILGMLLYAVRYCQIILPTLSLNTRAIDDAEYKFWGDPYVKATASAGFILMVFLAIAYRKDWSAWGHKLHFEGLRRREVGEAGAGRYLFGSRVARLPSILVIAIPVSAVFMLGRTEVFPSEYFPPIDSLQGWLVHEGYKSGIVPRVVARFFWINGINGTRFVYPALIVGALAYHMAVGRFRHKRSKSFLDAAQRAGRCPGCLYRLDPEGRCAECGMSTLHS